MKNYLLLISILSLTACGGSGGGGENGLTPAENLFGAGIGTRQTPTHLVPREDGAGFEILSFGAWGNVYDIKENPNNKIDLRPWGYSQLTNYSSGALYDFIGQQKLHMQENYRFAKDASVANSTFVGPAIAYHTDNSQRLLDSDYGTMKLQFGQDIDNTRLEFVMNNPANNLTVTGPENTRMLFDSSRENVAVSYWTTRGGDPVYVGYGSKR
jgi:hypothetical protein